MTIGIDKIGFYTPNVYLDMQDLAHARQVEYEKYTIGLGQNEMAVAPIYEDTVTMAAMAALNIIDDVDREAIDYILVGSESGIDQSKSIAIYVKNLAKLKDSVRAIEIKQACYGATAALQLAKGYVLMNKNSKVLVIASDIAKYGVKTAGEPTQGAGAVAILVSENPRIAVLNDESTYLTEDIMDFWRPNYSDMAFADGKFSTQSYIRFFETVWRAYQQKTNLDFEDFKAICFHLPFTKLGFKALKHVFTEQNVDEKTQNRLLESYKLSTTYNKRIGNIYTGSLYLSLLSLLESAANLKAGDRIGMFSYGSGAVGEFFSLTLVADYQNMLHVANHESLLNQRTRLSIKQYETIFNLTLPQNGEQLLFDNVPANQVVLTGINNHQRLYENRLK